MVSRNTHNPGNWEEAQLIWVITQLPKQSKKASSFHKMFASKNQVIEENASFNLLPSQDVQGHTSMREHQNNSPSIMLL
jgi:hypothetical protein